MATCKAFVAQLKAAGHDVELTEYPNVWHAFSYNDACVELSPHLGSDSAATADARMRVRGFLKTVFKLN